MRERDGSESEEEDELEREERNDQPCAVATRGGDVGRAVNGRV